MQTFGDKAGRCRRCWGLATGGTGWRLAGGGASGVELAHARGVDNWLELCKCVQCAYGSRSKREKDLWGVKSEKACKQAAGFKH